jgi:hypothetical protein
MQTVGELRTLRHGTPAPTQFNEYNGAPLRPSGITSGARKAMHW